MGNHWLENFSNNKQVLISAKLQNEFKLSFETDFFLMPVFTKAGQGYAVLSSDILLNPSMHNIPKKVKYTFKKILQ